MDPFIYFKDILSIPRESGNEKEISNYLVKFAKEYGYEYYQDDNYNVIIKRPSNCNSKETIILQGHIDMVCTSNIDYDFINKGIEWYIEEGFYKAKETTLGADNGIGCSIILSILSDKNIKVPNIEAVFTTNEETNMMGAKTLDYSKLNGKNLISIDGTDEGVIEVSSAGMVSMNIDKKLEYVDNTKNTYKISISGLPGGHSGTEIGNNRGNSIALMVDILNSIKNYDLVSIDGGSKYNVIPNSCVCIISTNEEINVDNFYNKEFSTLKITVEEVEKCAKVIKKDISNEIINFIHILPKEVVTYIDSYPQTSINLAIVETSYEQLSIKISIRSSNKEDEKKYVNIIKELCPNMEFNIVDSIPFFEFNKNSKIRDILVKKYNELYNKDIKLNHVHAGLEGGVFSEKINDIDICVIAPNLYDIHTVNERVEIDSVYRVYNWLVEALGEI